MLCDLNFFANYSQFGLKQMAYDAKFLRIPEICWLGAFPSDVETYGLSQQCLLPLTAQGEMDYISEFQELLFFLKY